jgi:hypothetical protein
MTSHTISETRGGSSDHRSGSAHRRAWLTAAVVALVVGVLAAGVWALFGLWSSWQAPDDFVRMSLPGTRTIQVQEAGDQYVYIEHPRAQSVPSLEALAVQVTGPGATPAAVDRSTVTLEYDAPQGRVGTLVGVFGATSAGSYTLSAGAPGPGLTLAVGESVAQPFTSALLRAGGVLGVAVLAAVGCFVMASRPVAPDPRAGADRPR